MKPRCVRSLLLLLLVVGFGAPVPAQVPAGGEFRLNTYTTGNQVSAKVALDGAGNFVAAWLSEGQDGSGLGIFARRYDAIGAPRGGEFRVNAYTSGDQAWGPWVAADHAGNVTVAWSSRGQDGDGWGVFAQRYDGSGVPLGAEFQVNTYTPSDQNDPVVASDPAGRFVVAWTSVGQDGHGPGVFARRYDGSGLPLGAEFQVNTYTSLEQDDPKVALDGAGNFVVAWSSMGQDGSSTGIYAQRYDASGVPLGAEFRVNAYTTSWQFASSVASHPAGNFVVAWEGNVQDGSNGGVFARRYEASGAPAGVEFQVNTYTTAYQSAPCVALDSARNFVVAWAGQQQDGSMRGVFARRFDATGAPRGGEFRVNTHTTGEQSLPFVASDPVGNFVVTWFSDAQDGDALGSFAQRFGGLHPAALIVDPTGTPGSDANRVLEPGETSVAVRPSWRNMNGAAQTFGGVVRGFTGPAAAGVTYMLPDGTAAYGTVPDGAIAQCTDCYQVGVGFAGTRPALHWDATLTERITPDAHGQTKTWAMHLGDSFTDVPRTNAFYRFVEVLLHKGVTGGCTGDQYCPASAVTREQMAPFVLVAKEGTGYAPAACTTPMFDDVPASSPFCKWIEELARRGVVAGCGGSNYCPTSPVTRDQMPVFVLRTLDPALDPPACTTPVFADVPASSPFCRWIEELARRGVVTGCGGGNYCPGAPVTREQMGVFISVTFGLTLYAP